MNLDARLRNINVYRDPHGNIDKQRRTWEQMAVVWQERLRAGAYSPVEFHRWMKLARYDREDLRRALADQRHLLPPCPVIDNYDIEAGQRLVDEYRAEIQTRASELPTLPWRSNPRPAVILKAIRDLEVGASVLLRYDANLAPPGCLGDNVGMNIIKETARAKRAEMLTKDNGRKYVRTWLPEVGISVTRVR